MAQALALVRRDDLIADVDSLSLLSYTDGFQLAEDGWRQAVAGYGDERVAEALTLRVSAASHDLLAVALQNLDAKVQQIDWHRDEVEPYGIWLRTNLRNEGGAGGALRQALVTAARRSALTAFSYSADNQSLIAEYGLALERTPWWEDTTVGTKSATAVNCVGGTAGFSAVLGDVPARLALVSFRGVSGVTGPLTKFWLGFRTARLGTVANFQSYWSLRKGALFGSDTTGGTSNVDTEAKDGYKAVCTFGTVATLLERVRIRVTDVTANPGDQRGSYAVLLRAKNTAAGTTRVRLKDGLYNSCNNLHSRVLISSTSYQYYELGTVQIPSPGRYVAGVNMMTAYAMAIDAERVSGTPSLDLAELVLIPTTEGFVASDTGGGGVEYVAADERPLYVQHRPEGRIDAIYNSGSIPQYLGSPTLVGGLPNHSAGGILVVAGQRLASSVLADTVSLTLKVSRRGAQLRGAE